MTILTTPPRIAQMLVDCHSSIYGAYDLTQGAIDQLERPCWLIFCEDASFPGGQEGQEQVEQGYSVAYIGHVYNQAEDNIFSSEYELLAREVADAAVLYFLEHPQLQVSNERGLLPAPLSAAPGIMHCRITRRSAVSLYSRDAVSGESFWGFTIDLSVREVLVYEITP